MENTKYGRRREGRWTPIRAEAQDTKANPNSWETHLVRKRWDIGLLRALSLWIMMMMMIIAPLECRRRFGLFSRQSGPLSSCAGHRTLWSSVHGNLVVLFARSAAMH